MKLDELVCRGTLIIHKGERLVVLGPGVHVANTPSAHLGRYMTQQRFGWRVMSADQFKPDAIRVCEMRTIDKEEDVDMFFPGSVYPLPDYIR